MYRPFLVTAPVIKPVTLTEAKAALDIEYDDKDTLIDGLIAAATSYLDGWTGTLGRALCEQTWRQDFDGFSCWSQVPGTTQGYSYGALLRLPLFPVISVTSVKYTDTLGVEQTISAANYTLRNDDLGAYVQFIPTFAFPNFYLGPASVRVAYVAGYADAAGVSTAPDAIKQAMFLMIRQWFDNPASVVIGQTVQHLPMAAEALLAPFRRVRF